MNFISLFLCSVFLLSKFFVPFFRHSEGNIVYLTAFYALFIFSGIFNCFGARCERMWIFSNIQKNKLKIENGTLQVYYTKFRFTSKNLEQVYDGRVQDTAPDVYYQESQLKKYGLTV